MKKVKVITILVSLAIFFGFLGIASAGTLDEILKRGEIRIACQTQGAPFSFVDRNGNRTGSSVELCNLIAKEMGLNENTILLEPIGRNTAPAIAVAALQALEQDKDPQLLVLAADHVIEDVNAFTSAIDLASLQAKAGRLATFGIVPTQPETGYGYIRRGEALDDAFAIVEFVEKPDRATAEGYLASGEYYWNSGMFLFHARRYLEELEQQRPDILAACRNALAQSRKDLDFLRLDRDAFAACPSDSIDYAVMEKTRHGCVVPLDAGWNDIGSWSALWEMNEKDNSGNAMHGDVMLFDTEGSLVYGEERLVTTVGVKDLVVIETKDAVLVADKHQSQQVKAIVEDLRRNERSEDTHHRVVYRPWGHFDSIEEGERFKVKRITVKPGARLSLQMHHHRAEHWVVVSGTAKVRRGDKVEMLSEDESIYIDVGEKHSLENPGTIPLEVIEVQTGSYLGEDDIVRFEDQYGRDKS